jgi:drug/metabolite transporter (DMT)-like permease
MALEFGSVTAAGLAAGLATALLWGGSALTWGLAGRRIGALAVNCLRLVLALGMLAGARWVFRHSPWPMGLPREQMLMLLLSGVVGAGLADMCYFHGLVIIGPRLGTLIMSAAPIFAAAAAYLTPMREALPARAVVGIVLTVAGVAWVVSDRSPAGAWKAPAGSSFALGMGLTIFATVLVGLGMAMSRWGMLPLPDGRRVTPFDGTMLRIAAAGVVTWGYALGIRRLGQVGRAVADRRSMAIVVVGTIIGPVVGIWMSMVSLDLLPAGVASALIATSPIFMIPIAYIAYGDRPTLRGLAGTLLAVAGLAVMVAR